MRIAMRPYFVSSLDHHTHLLRKGFERMPGDKPRRLEVVLVKSFSRRGVPISPAKRPRKCRLGNLPAIGPEPSRHGIDIVMP
jgi:hypothetical protein